MALPAMLPIATMSYPYHTPSPGPGSSSSRYPSRPPHHNSASSTTYYHHPSSHRPASNPDLATLQRLLRTLLPSRPRLTSSTPLRAPLHTLHLLQTSDGPSVLKTPAPSATHLLRHETAAIASEANVLTLLSRARLPTLPSTLAYDPSGTTSLPGPLLLRAFLSGTPYPSVQLPAQTRARLEGQLGAILAAVCGTRLGAFGSTPAVWAGRGARSWSAAFAGLVEQVLRDGEDVLLVLPYERIRGHVAAFSSALDAITDARCVPLGLDESGILVEERGGEWWVTGLLGWGGTEGGGARVRGLLYAVYRALVAIVTAHVRPGSGGEFEARRTLTAALGELDCEAAG
ncbi:hypothetical protein EJ06DRAFT_582640 [Trichodelitschia bisporula]|uniref:Aminoglycoside phosphotransferase domain-containing protein n=1 Tax=Trichodelitschia bisporula TaxID=703511 RepID=A0A6G1HWG3_9PEZI|nr:hypothetical protein EJ06DRAFT_582640 [Trichodelitschia bisporula]